MPMYDFVCARKHETTRMFPVNQIHYLPAYIKCPVHLSTTHSPGCAKIHGCGLRAKRVEVYTPGIGGDLPTRGAF